MVVAGAVVGAAIVGVLAHATVFQFTADAFASDRLAAVRTLEKATGKRKVGRSRPPIPTVQDVLADVERRPVNEAAILSLEDLPVPLQLTDVEAVVENVRERCAVKFWLALAVDVPLALKFVRQRLEGVAAGGVQFKHANQRPRLFWVRLDWLVAVLDVHVAERCVPRRPALSDLLVHSLQYFGPQVVAVVLGDGGHHVERERSSGTGAELVVYEGQLHPAGVFEFLQANRVPHVAADAVELVAQDRLDLLFLGVGLHPGEHLIERAALRTAFRRLGNDELSNDMPAIGQRPVAVDAKLGVDGIPFLLLAG